MCELFGVSARREMSFTDWLIPFRSRGGGSADNPDGWGIASWVNNQASIEKYPEPGWRSERFQELAKSVTGQLLMAHVRKARNPPTPGLLNTHPFAHSCCGREWVFAHNGMVPDVIEQSCPGVVCHPEGNTDSEFAFCHLLAGIVDAYDDADISHWLGQLANCTTAIAILGQFNFLLSDGCVLIAHGHDRLHYSERPNGLALLATDPMDAGDWQAFKPGELRVYRDGALLASLITPRSDEARRL